ncbi:Bor family protein [Oceanospirillum beijerinckii]|uniref:Bor family protein n=1 Tax=Oceanospirillum beijerinckii TaxID=64976 RepID=UPI000427C463|nr:Bor family protein [Oceanospirillum beijerinckii]MAC48048.1 Bor family protein [Oceanospirillum sp.]
MKGRYLKQLLIVVLATVLSACSSVTLRTDSAEKTKNTPDFQQSYDYWWWGLKGKHSINVREVCQGRKVKQMQSVATISNVFVSVITFGIYQPRTARVWCEVSNNG